MKRSEINAALRELEAMCKKYSCFLPPFCHFTPDEWKTKGHEYDEIRDCMLGWDITDFGLGDFDKFGFSLITIRNGCRTQPEKYPKVYAEKLLYLKEGQMAANHFHWYKTEDIINRGGGNCLIRVYNSLPNEEIDYESDVEVHCDGLKRWSLVRENQQSSAHNFVKDFSLLFPKICRLCPLKKGAATENPLEYGKTEVQILFEPLQAAISSMELPKNFENKKLPNPLR